jgi:hypothetical protein
MKMAKSKRSRDTSKGWTTPSRFGSHSSMVVDPNEVPAWKKNMNAKLAKDEVMCEDDDHYYITKKNRIDSGMADPNRYSKKVIFIKESV